MEKATYSVSKVQEAAKLVKQFNWSYKELNCGEGIFALENLFQQLYDLTGDFNFFDPFYVDDAKRMFFNKFSKTEKTKAFRACKSFAQNELIALKNCMVNGEVNVVE